MIALVDAIEKTWNLLKNHFTKISILAYSDFSKLFILYMNKSKKYDFKIAVHQIKLNDIEHSVLFLSKCLKEAKKTYWLTELKYAALVWALIKLSHFFDSDNFIVITNHAALLSALQIKTTDWWSTRLNK